MSDHVIGNGLKAHEARSLIFDYFCLCLISCNPDCLISLQQNQIPVWNIDVYCTVFFAMVAFVYHIYVKALAIVSAIDTSTQLRAQIQKWET